MKQALLAGIVAVGLFVVFVGGSVFYMSWSACLGGESATLSEFPHYADPERGPSPLMGLCEVRYTTEASKREVLGHYDERLRQNGWNGLEFHAYHPYERGVGGEYALLSEALKTPRAAVVSLAARRDGYDYRVTYEPPDKKDPDLPDDRALVTVSVSE